MQGRGGGGVINPVGFDCPEFDDGDEKFECLWERIRRVSNKAVWWECDTVQPTRTKRHTKHSATEDDK